MRKISGFLYVALFVFLYFIGQSFYFRLVLANSKFEITKQFTLEKEFTSRGADNYSVILDFDRLTDRHTESCLLGEDSIEYKRDCAGIPKELEIEWELTKDGRRIESGVSGRDRGPTGWGKKISRQLVNFNAESFSTYRIKATSVLTSLELNKRQPRLIVEMSGRSLEGKLFLNSLLAIVFVISFVLGAISTASEIWASRRSKT